MVKGGGGGGDGDGLKRGVKQVEKSRGGEGGGGEERKPQVGERRGIKSREKKAGAQKRMCVIFRFTHNEVLRDRKMSLSYTTNCNNFVSISVFFFFFLTKQKRVKCLTCFSTKNPMLKLFCKTNSSD